jgi:hypothetical protein
VRLPSIRAFDIAATISSSVMSGCSAVRESRNCACSSSGETLPPLDLAAMLPVSLQRCIQITTTLGLIPKSSAASRRDAPPSTASTTRIRKSGEYGFGIGSPKIESIQATFAHSHALGNPPKINRFNPIGKCSNAQGDAAKGVLVEFHDGKFHPVTGVPAYDAEAEKDIDDSTAWIIRTKAGKVVQTLIAEVSADRKTWTVTQGGINANGQPFNNVVVRERQ